MSSSKKPKISVIIPVFNAEEYLERCIKSVISQTLKEIEIFCIDDGSIDGSWNIIQEFAERDERIFATRQKNSGAAIARNKGLERAMGEYVGFVDSDDYVDKDYFEKLYKAAKDKKADIAMAYVKAELADDSDESKKEIGDPKEYEDYFNVLSKSRIEENKLNLKNVVWRSIYKKSVLEKYNIAFHPELRTGQDNVFNLEISYYANRIEFVSEPTYYHRVVRSGSLMTEFNYTGKGVISRSLVLMNALKFLNSKPEYDKDVYISRVIDNISFLQRRLHLVSNLFIIGKTSKYISSTWRQIKYKEEILPIIQAADSAFSSAIGSRRKLFWYIFKLTHPNVMKIKNGSKKIAKALLPYGMILLWRRYKVHNSVQQSNSCPICGYKGEFLPMASTGGTRQKAVCPNCGSLERHRLIWLFINRKIGLKKLKNKSFLHVAAEAMLEPKFRQIVGKKYLTADYLVKADVKMDITDIKYKDNSFDIIMCNHVLEHVSDDRKAMKEMYRVLKPGGWAIFLVPLADMPTTYENKKVTTDEGRLKHFGQADHVRKYGRDYIDRLKDAGWKVEIYKAGDIASVKEIKRSALVEDAKLWGFTSTEIFFCTK